MRLLKLIAMILVVVGAINWGLWGFFQFDLVAFVFGGNTTGMARVVYSLVGLAGLWSIKLLCCCSCKCGSSCSSKGKGGSCCK